mmetsp:Transcript_12490/g.41976  ORF Transcript_12490/g.41976 Transcript_12490/m.41976 type:complete len:289 (-) Transcript_12490:995-1861(-)
MAIVGLRVRQREHRLLDGLAVGRVDRVVREVSQEGRRGASPGGGARSRARLDPQQLRVRDAEVAPHVLWHAQRAVELHRHGLVVQPRRGVEHLCGRVPLRRVRRLEQRKGPQRVCGHVMVSCHHLGPAARLRRPRKREAGQRARRPRGPLLGVEGRPAPHHLGHEAYWPELIAAPPRLVSGVHPATHVHFEAVVVCVEELLHEETARRGAVGVARPRDAVEAGACSRRAPDEPAELRVVEVEDGQPRPHGESAVEVAHRVDYLRREHTSLRAGRQYRAEHSEHRVNAS